MDLPDSARQTASTDGGCAASDITIAQLVGQVYEAAPPSERGSLLEPLLRPLGVLSLFGIADGIFAKVRLRSGWQDFHVRVEDTHNVRASDVIALVDHVQQVSVDAVDALARTLSASPVLAGSAAAALLATMLVHRARLRADSVPGPGHVRLRRG
jgi:hypothetical protein